MKKVLTLLTAFVLVFGLSACGNTQEDIDNLADAVQKLNLDVDYSAVTGDVELPATGLHEATITWESSNTDVIANDGTVTRPAIGEEPVTVKVTATITIGKQTETKEFTLKVLALVPSNAVTIAELESDAIANKAIVEVTGIVTGIINSNGFHLYDETGSCYVYMAGSFDAKVGDNVTVTGEKGVYNSSVQVTYVDTVVINSSNNTLPEHTETTLLDIFAEDPATTTIYNDMFEFDAYVVRYGEHNNVYLVWYDENLDLVASEVYYTSGSFEAPLTESLKLTELKELTGKKITAQTIIKDDGYGAFRMTVDTPSTFTELTLTDQEKANLAVALQDTTYNTLGKVLTDLDFEATDSRVAGAALTWTSSDTAAIANDGTVTLSATEKEVTITITATVGTATATKTHTVTVGTNDDAKPLTVSEALAKPDGESVLIQGVIAGLDKYNNPILQGADGKSLYLYYVSYDGEIGDEVLVSGPLTTYNGLRELDGKNGGTILETLSTGNALVYNTTATPAELANLDNFEAVQQEIYTIELTVKTISDGDYTLFVGSDSVDLSLYTKENAVQDLYQDGDKVTLSFFVKGKGDTYLSISLIALELSNAEKVDAVDAAIALSGDVTADVELPTTMPDYDATITWTSSDLTALALDGTVTRPAAGEADVTVTLEASIVIGTDAAVVKTYTVTVLAEPTVVVPPKTVAEAIALDDDTAVELTGIVSYIDGNGSLLLQDPDGAAGVYAYKPTLEGVTVGDLVVFTAVMDSYNGQRQLADVVLVEVTSSGNPVPEVTGVTGADVVTNYEQYVNRLVSIEVTITQLDGGNYTSFEGDGTKVLSAYTNGHPMRDTFMDNDVVLLTFFVKTSGSSYISIEMVDIEATGDPVLNAVNAAIAVSGDVTEDLTLLTTVAEQNATITWTSSNTDVVANDGTVTRPTVETGDVEVTLIASIVIDGAAAVEKVYTVNVKAEVPATPSNVATAVAAADGDDIFVEGVVTAILVDGTFVIEDTDGTAIVIDDYAPSIDFAALTIAVGDKVQVTGVKTEYSNKIVGVDTVSSVVVIDSGNAISEPIIITDPSTFRDTITKDMFNKRYTFSITAGVDYDGYYTYFYNNEGTNRLGIVMSMSFDGLTIADGDTLDFTAVLYGTSGDWNDNTKIFRFAILNEADIVINAGS